MEQALAEALQQGVAALNAGKWTEALYWGRQAYARRKQEPAVWQLLFRACLGAGRFWEAGFWQGLCGRWQGKPYYVPEAADERAAILQGIGFGQSDPQIAPFYQSVTLSAARQLNSQPDCVLGECLPAETTGQPGYFVGVYNPENKRDVRGMMAARLQAQHTESVYYGDMTFDLMRAARVQDVSLAPDGGETYIQPVVAAEPFQRLHVALPQGEQGDVRLAQYETTFLRVDQPVRLSAEAPFWLGSPVLLTHRPERCKVVLSILLDGLSWGAMQQLDYADIPHIREFFARGLVFDETYAGSEFTYPSLATIETGMLPTTSQLFSAQAMARLEPERRTLTEQLQALGYYTVCAQGCAEGVFNGVSRGFDRLLVNHCLQPAGTGVERTLQQLAAFHETDQYIFLWATDSHPFNDDMRCAEQVQTQLSLAEQLAEERATSVFMRASRRNQLLNRRHIRDLDRQLGLLFDYLTAHYTDDEFLVCLFSDHGCSIYSEQPWLLSRMHTNSALMLRGWGVPQGVQAQELVSTADIYAIMGHYAGFAADAPHLDSNLPACCGGQARELVLSQSIFPGQTRKICLRTPQYMCRFETEHETQADGSAMMAPFSLHVYERASEKQARLAEVQDAAVRQAFLTYLQAHAAELMLAREASE